MKTSVLLSVISSVAILSLSASAMAADPVKTFTFGGNVELDVTADDGADAGNNFGHGGRVLLNAVGEMKGDNYFVKGVAQPLVPFKGSSLGYDDVYLQMGRDKWDVQIGRFEAANLFPLGKDTIISHAGGGEAKVYEANKVRGRKDDVLHVALHSKPSDQLKLELGLMHGKADSDSFTGCVQPCLTRWAIPLCTPVLKMSPTKPRMARNSSNPVLALAQVSNSVKAVSMPVSLP
nr:carbohydrate porin [Thiothrix subterranea]